MSEERRGIPPKGAPVDAPGLEFLVGSRTPRFSGVGDLLCGKGSWAGAVHTSASRGLDLAEAALNGASLAAGPSCSCFR